MLRRLMHTPDPVPREQLQHGRREGGALQCERGRGLSRCDASCRRVPVDLGLRARASRRVTGARGWSAWVCSGPTAPGPSLIEASLGAVRVASRGAPGARVATVLCGASTATAPGSGWWCFSSSAVVATSGLVLTAAAPARPAQPPVEPVDRGEDQVGEQAADLACGQRDQLVGVGVVVAVTADRGSPFMA